MDGKQKVLIVLRGLVLVAALGVVALGAWSKFIIHDVEIRGEATIQAADAPEDSARYWRQFFVVVLNSTLRIWISIAAGSVSFLMMMLVILSLLLKRLEMPSSVRVPLELMSLCGMAAAFGCTLSFTLALVPFTTTQLETSSTDLEMFTMIIPLSKALVVTSGSGFVLNMITAITEMVQACLRARAKESCSFEPTASSLGMSGQRVTIPSVSRSRVPTMYDPRRPLPSNQDDEEKGLVDKEIHLDRVDSGASDRSESPVIARDQWPLATDKPQQVLHIRPSRPWSEAPQPKRSPGVHAY